MPARELRAAGRATDAAGVTDPVAAGAVGVLRTAAERRELLVELYERVRDCRRCEQLADARLNVVFGAGNADAELLFIGEAPGATEDERGLPFVGRAGMLLERLLGEIGMSRGEVFIANVLKCRPPGNRDPREEEIEHCREYLHAQVELIRPRLICTLGNFATKLLRGDPTGITRVHGTLQQGRFGAYSVALYPLYHPAAALRSPKMLDALRADFARLPELIATSTAGGAEAGGGERRPAAAPVGQERPLSSPGADDHGRQAGRSGADQLGLF